MFQHWEPVLKHSAAALTRKSVLAVLPRVIRVPIGVVQIATDAGAALLGVALCPCLGGTVGHARPAAPTEASSVSGSRVVRRDLMGGSVPRDGASYPWKLTGAYAPSTKTGVYALSKKTGVYALLKKVDVYALSKTAGVYALPKTADPCDSLRYGRTWFARSRATFPYLPVFFFLFSFFSFFFLSFFLFFF